MLDNTEYEVSLIDPKSTRCHKWIFHIGARRDTFHILICLYIALCNGASICKYKAYWHMSLSLINGCGTRKNNICGHSFEVALVSSPNIIIVTKK